MKIRTVRPDFPPVGVMGKYSSGIEPLFMQEKRRTMIIETRWGNYEVVRELPGYKIKILTVNPGCGISYQKHFNRAEQWYMVEGEIKVAHQYGKGKVDILELVANGMDDNIYIFEEDWHQFWNFSDKPAKILEIQIGECEEEDIQRTQYEWIGDQ